MNKNSHKKRIVVIGGGTGTYTVLLGLKKHPHDLSVIITMTDSGGSNRIIRDEFGLLPTSDIRQCMVALASERSSEVMRNLFTYRYSNGTGISGMTFGNLFMAALSDIYGSQKLAIEKTCEMLDVQGEIIPMTYENTNLVATYENGKQVLGEHYIDEPEPDLVEYSVVHLEVFPRAKANADALKAIAEADLIVFGPGDLYTSILCNVVIDGVAEALKKSKAKKVFVMNLMTRYGQTHGYTAKKHISEMEKYIGKGTLDICLMNDTEFSPQILKMYKATNAVPVVDDLDEIPELKVIRTGLASGLVHEKSKADKLQRSFIRHDSDKLAKALVSLL